MEAVWITLGGILLCAGMVWIFVSGIRPTGLTVVKYWIAVIVGPPFALGTLCTGLYGLLVRQSYLKTDVDGVWQDHSFWRARFIPWTGIRAVQVHVGGNGAALCIFTLMAQSSAKSLPAHVRKGLRVQVRSIVCLDRINEHRLSSIGHDIARRSGTTAPEVVYHASWGELEKKILGKLPDLFHAVH